MINAKNEFLNHLNGTPRVKAAVIYKDSWRTSEKEKAVLKVDHSDEDYLRFLQDLDFEYDDGFGSQELYGTIWFEDGTWSERGEYDGSEWWEHKSCPKIDEQLLNS